MKTAKIGNVQSFVDRIDALKKAHRAKKLKSAAEFERIASGKITVAMAKKHWFDKPEEYRQWCLDQAARCRDGADKTHEVLSIKFYPRLKYFKNYKDSCGFDPVTGDGHSYDWYALTKVIKGKLVLNTYRYSVQTSKHIGMMSGLFREMGLKYVSIDAPMGLQDLNKACAHIVQELGKAMIKKSHAKKRTGYDWLIRDYRKQLKTLKAIGYPVSQRKVDATIKAMFQDDAEERAAAKERGKQLQAMRRALQPKVESTEAISLINTAA